MQKNPKEIQDNPCTNNKSAFKYDLLLKPDGSVVVSDECGNPAREFPEKSGLPPIKEIINTRTVTILEARGSQWIFVVPPGRWYRLS